MSLQKGIFSYTSYL